MAARDGSAHQFGFSIDGVTYRIDVQADGSQGYLARWRCATCKPPTWSTLHESSVEEAVRVAELVVRDHHERFHGGAQT